LGLLTLAPVVVFFARRPATAPSVEATPSGGATISAPATTDEPAAPERPAPEALALFAHPVPAPCRPVRVEERGTTWLTAVWCSWGDADAALAGALADAPLRAEYWYEVTTPAAASSLGRAPWVRKLRVGHDLLAHLAPLPALEELIVVNDGPDGAPSAAVDVAPLAAGGAFPALRSLRLERSIPSAVAVLGACPSLRSLAFEDVTKAAATGARVRPDDVATLTSLASLEVRYQDGQAVDFDLKPLRRLGGLARLVLVTSGTLRGAGGLGALSGLEELELSDCSSGGALRSFLGGLTRLRAMTYRNAARDVAWPAGAARALRSLTIGSAGCVGRLGEESAEAAVDLGGLDGAELRELAVQGVASVRLPPRLPALEALELDAPVDPALAAAVASYVTLRRLTVTVSSDSTPGGLGFVRGLRRLKSLTARHGAFDDLGPVAALTELEELDVFRSRRVTDVAPLAGLGALRYVDIAGTGVTSLAPLVAAGALEAVDVYGAPVRDADAFRRARPRVRLLPRPP
jgi:internalin A